MGVTRLGEFDKTTQPVPVVQLTPVPPESIGNGVDRVRLVALATPKIGVIKVGDVAITGAPEPVKATHCGTPAPVVTRPALSTVDNPAIVFAALEYSN